MKRAKRTPFVLLSAVVIGAGVLPHAGRRASAAEPTPEIVREGEGKRVHDHLSTLAEQGFSGVALLVRRGETVLRKGYGLADRERKRPMTPDTIFDIGSITKPITAAAILELESEGKLRGSDPIGRFFDGVPTDKAGITIDHLLQHNSGLDDVFGGDYDVVSREWVLEKALASKLLSKPGEKVRYSNSGYSLLAMIVEKTSGLTYERYVHDNLFVPAGVPEIGYRIPKWPADKLAVGYEKEERWGTPLDHPWAEDGPSWNLRGNGGMLATVDQLRRLMEALLSGPTLPDPARARFLARFVRTGDDGRRRLRVIGGNGIFNADYVRRIDEDVTFVLMTSVDRWQGEFTTPRLLELLQPAQ